MATNTISVEMLAKMFLAGAQNIEAKKEYINELNVFPVPDGDTGTNMSMTIMAAAKEVTALADMDIASVCKAISSGSLRGARGNSGVILSQLLRGFTKSIKEEEVIDVPALARAAMRAKETAYKAVMRPKEGTILTVARGMADKAMELALETDDMEVFISEVIKEGEVVLAQTPDMLPVLKEAGVVDSGGQGLMQVLKGAYDALLGKEVDYTIDVPAAGSSFVKISAETEAAEQQVRADVMAEEKAQQALEKEKALELADQQVSFLESIGFSVAEKEANGTLGEYKVLFDELNTFTVTYNNKWKNVTIGENSLDKKQKCETPYLFYFEEGKTYSLKMEVTLGDYSTLIARLQAAIDELSAIYRKIIAYTTTSPDANRDYELTKKFPELFYGVNPETGEYETTAGGGKFYKVLEELTDISTSIKKISAGYAPDADIPEKVYKQGASDKTGVIDSVVVILQKMVDKPREITKRLNSYSTNVSSLGSLLTELREAPLTIDYIEIHTPDVKLDKPNAGFFRSLWDGIASFFASFFIDYSSISETGDTTNSDITVEVWMTLGRDQANVVRNLIDTSFTGDSGYAVEHYGKNINVDLKLTGGDVLLKATLAGIGPDVALNVDSSLPVNWALRNAVFDLTEFDDFWETVYAIPDGSQDYDESFENIYMASSIRQFQFSALDAADHLFDSKKYKPEELKENITGVYALPEKQIFLMMFVRDDVMEELKLTDMFPDGWDSMTWDDMLRLTAELQAQQLQFYLPVNDLGANALNPIFISLLYQYGGELYSTNNMESGLKSEEAMNAFEFWTELYTNYSFPTSASFVNRFRTGEMPIGISYYEMYNTLSVFAPELKGKWSFHLIPGTAELDADGNPVYDEYGKQKI